MRLRKALSWGYVVALSLTVAASLYFVTRAARFETNILALLPSIYRDEEIESVMREQAERFSARVVVFARGTSGQEAERVAADVAEKMRASGLFDSVEDRVTLARLRDLRDLFMRAPFQLTDPPHEAVDEETLLKLLDAARERAFSLEGLEWLTTVGKDPLLLFPAYAESAVDVSPRVSARNGYLRVDGAGTEIVLIVATLSRRGINQHTDRPVTRFFESLPTYPSIQVVPTGVVFFAEESAGRMEREITTISTVTLVALLALFLWVFRSVRAVSILMATVITSCLGAVLLSALAWRAWSGHSIHVMTIAFGSALLGVSSDYAVHYLVTQRAARHGDGRGTLPRIVAGLFLAFLTSIVGFLGIALSPFPGLQQLAVFSYIGLALSLLAVIICFPFMAGPSRHDARIGELARRARHLVSRRVRLIVTAALVAPVAYGMTKLQALDDIRALDTPALSLVERQREAARLLGATDGGTFLVVRGSDEEQLLRREEAVVAVLERLRAEDKLDSFRAVSRLVPSRQRQQERYERYARALSAAPELVTGYERELGLPQESVELLRVVAQGAPPRFLSLAECLSTSACDSSRDLVSRVISGEIATIVPLSGLQRDAVSAIREFPGVTVIHQADEISSGLRLYRESAVRATIVFYALVFMLLAIRYGARGACLSFMPPILGGAAALGTLGIAGVPLNVFSVFALMVLLGVSVDYAIFFAEDGDEEEGGAALSVVLSAMTTAISFGFLSVSSSPALQGFGIVLSVGVLVAALVAPLAYRGKV